MSAPSAPPRVSSDDEDRGAIDLTALVDEATLGFVRNGHRWERDATTYVTRVDEDGTATLTPRGGRALHIASSFDEPTIASLPTGASNGSVAVEHLRADGVRVVERFRNTRDGLSQTWELGASPLHGAEDAFLVHVALDGLTYEGASTTGHRFVDPKGGPSVRYGNATFVDRDHRRTALEVIRDRDGVAVVVPRAVLEHATYPAVVDPILGVENVLDNGGTGSSSGSYGAIVERGPAGTFLALWPRIGALLARRVLADGTVVEPGIVLPLDNTSAAVAWNPVAAQWLVVATSRAHASIRGVRVAANGTLVDPEPFTILGDEKNGDAQSPAVGFDGAGWLVAATIGDRLSSNRDLSAIRVSAAGKLASAPIVLPTDDDFARATGVACTPTTCAVSWSDGTGMHLGRVSPANAALDPGGKSLGLGSGGGIATDGTSFAVTWQDSPSINVNTIYTARVAADGTVNDSPALVASPNANAPSVCWDGSNYVVGHLLSNTTESARRLPLTGPFSDASSVALLTLPAMYYASVGCNGADHLATGTGTTGIRGTRVSPAFAPLDAAPGIDISRSRPEQRAAAAAWNGTSGYVVWNDFRDGQNPNQVGAGDLYGIRVSATGAPVGTAISLASGIYEAEVASDGKDFILIYPDGGRGTLTGRVVKAVRISAATGQVLDTPPIVVTTNMHSYFDVSKPRVTFDGTNYVVAWTDNRFFRLSDGSIFAARVSPAGQVLDPDGIAVCVVPEHQVSPAIASDGTTGSLIVWGDGRNDYPQLDLYGARISNAGTVLDPGGKVLAAAGSNQFEPVVTWDGTNYQVAWLDGRRLADSRYNDVYTARVSPAGAMLDPLGLLVAELGDYPTISIASMGDGRTSLLAFDQAGVDARGVRGAWIRTKSGEVLDPGGITLAAAPSQYVALAPAGAGRALFAYSRVRPEEMNVRVMARLVTTGAIDGTACSDEKECTGRFCRDGVCCNEACDGACLRCGTNGTCVAVTGADDPDTCTGGSTCDATGACKKKNGASCDAGMECASGFCADHFCCETACDGACDVCNAPPGKCTMLPARSPGTPACLPFVCNGASGTCPAKCLSDDDCADGFGCDRPSGTCRTGSVCTDRVTVRTPTRATNDCRPYACNDGACITSCKSVSDCAFPASCDENGRCVTADLESGSGCAVSRSPTRTNAPWLLVGLALLFVRRRRVS